MDLTLLVNAYGLLGLFLVNFLAGSIVPFPSEPATVLAATYFDPWSVFAVALAGNFLGGLTIYWIGLKGIRSLMKGETKDIKKARRLINKYGFAMLLAAPWVPMVGDPALIVAGMLKMDFRKFVLYTLTAKAIKIFAMVMLGIGIAAIA